MALHLPVSARSSTVRTKFLRFIGSAVTLLVALPASAQYDSFWQRAELETQLSATVSHDSNILNTDSELSDFIIQAMATETITQEFKNFTLGVELTGVITRYVDYDVLSSENFFLNWIIDTDEAIGDRRYQLNFDFDLSENSQSNIDVQGQVTTRSLNTGATLTYKVSRAMSANLGARYSIKDPKGDVYRYDPENPDADLTPSGSAYQSTATTLSGGLSWRRSKDLSINLRGSLSRNESENEDRGDSDTLSLTAGLNGQILPRLDGKLSAGLQQRDFEGETTSTPTLTAGLNYQIDDLSSAALTASHSFGTSLNGAETLTTNFALSYVRQISRLISVNGSVSYRTNELTSYIAVPTGGSELDGFELGSGGDTGTTDDEGTFAIAKLETENTQLGVRGGLSFILSQRSSVSFSGEWTDSEGDSGGGQSSGLRLTGAYSYTF